MTHVSVIGKPLKIKTSRQKEEPHEADKLLHKAFYFGCCFRIVETRYRLLPENTNVTPVHLTYPRKPCKWAYSISNTNHFDAYLSSFILFSPLVYPKCTHANSGQLTSPPAQALISLFI
jgi:hypothetical protein